MTTGPDTKTILVTGSAGYIGSHACKALAQAGFVPVTYDSLFTGWQDAVKVGLSEQGGQNDRASLDKVFAKYQPQAVMHFAALSQVGEAMKEPARYWSNNVTGSLTLIEAAVAAGCLDFVFSSTCATYVDQDNVVLDAIDGKQDGLTLHGTDYDTLDGTSVRDYVHVCELVDAHFLGLNWMQTGNGSRKFYLGTGSEFSVLGVIEQSKTVTNRACRAPPCRGLHQAGVRLGEHRRRAGLEAKMLNVRDDDHRRVALASNRHLREMSRL